eukprot:scaffold3751_cov300-Chaetoceros_neogracile.AAC.7
MARDNFIDNPAEEDKNCSMHNIFTLLRNEEEVEELDVVLASTDSTAAAGTVPHVADHADVADILQWLNDNDEECWHNINSIGDFGFSALHIAFDSRASLEVINGLLGKLNEKTINAIDNHGRSALHFACRYGASWEVINGLLGKLDETVINAIDNDGSSAFHFACRNKASWEIINSLLDKLDEKVINAINRKGKNALNIVCANKTSWEVINRLLGKLDEKAINAINNDGRSALHFACRYGASWEVINGLLGKLDETVINATTTWWGDTALHWACDFGASSEVINAIITHKNGKKLLSIKNIHGKLPFDIFPDVKERRNEHLKKLLNLHKLMEDNDPTASSYPNGLLQSILNLPSEDRDEFEFMNHSYFRKTINAKIIQPFSLSILFLDVAVQGLVMAVFSFTINGAVKELPTTSMAGLIPCLLWLLFREIAQYLSATTKFYFGDAANFVDIIQIVLVVAVLLISFIGKTSIDEGLLVACIGVAWTRLIFVISNLHYSLALFVAALLQVIKVLIPFMLVVSMICAAVAHIFHALYPLIDGSPCFTSNLEDQDCEWTSSLTKSYFHTFAMTLTGDWEFLTSNIGPLSYLAMIFAFTMGIILMNMVIAVISNKYTEVEAKSEIAFWESRLRYIVEVESMKRIHRIVSSIDSIVGRMCCFVRGKDEDNDKVKETSVRPARMSMEHSMGRVEWEQVGPKYMDFLDWFWDYRDRPTFLKRMSCFLEIAKWSEIFSISEGFRLCFLGIRDDNKEDATWFKHAMARVGLFGIVFVLCLLYAVIVAPLGLLTGGYLWAREVKEYIFWGDMHEPKLSGDSKILKREIDTVVKEQINELKEQNKEQIKELKDQNRKQIDELKEQMKQILDAVAGKKS